MSYLSKRRRSLMQFFNEKETKELLFTTSANSDGRIIVPISFDSSTATFECENVPEISVTNFQWNVIPKGNATTGFPRRTISGANLERIDSTHAKSKDAYAVSIPMTCSNFYFAGNKSFISAESFATDYLVDGTEYLFEVNGYHRVQAKSAVAFLSGGWQSVYMKTTNQDSNDFEIFEKSNAIFSIDKTNNILTIKEVTIDGFKNSNGTLVSGKYVFDDSTNVSIGQGTRRFPFVVDVCGEVTINLYQL